MKILQLCCFTNLWSNKHQVESWDIKNGRNVFDMPNDYGKKFDLVIAAPPCNQYTVANNRNWLYYPTKEILITKKCLKICQLSSSWILETTIGRIEKFFPELNKYRIGIWQSRETTKKHVIYSNLLLLFPYQKGKKSIVDNRSVEWRESWQPDFIKDIEYSCELVK